MGMLRLILILVASYAHISYGANLLIDSKSLVIDRKTNSAYFEGGVKLVYSDITLIANEIRVYFEEGSSLEQGKYKKIVIKNGFRAQKDKDIIIGTDAEFDVKASKLVLKGGLTIRKDDMIFHIDKIEINTKLNTIEKITK